jgi:hypothetical protein
VATDETAAVEQPSGGQRRQSIASAASGQPAAADEVIIRRSLSIVLPAYNKEAVIASTVQPCLQAAERFCPNVTVIVVDDGSCDRTGEIIDELAAVDERVVALHHSSNQGYGAALLTGLAAAQGELLFFMDSDGQFDFADIAALLHIQEQNRELVVLGYREHRHDSFPRHLNAWGWKQAVRLILGLKAVRDIDCAFMLLPTRVVRASGVTAQGALVNAELLVMLQRMRVPMVQVPVHHFPRFHGAVTGASPRVILTAFRELLHLRLCLGRPRAQDVHESQLEPLLSAQGIVVAREGSPASCAEPVTQGPVREERAIDAGEDSKRSDLSGPPGVRRAVASVRDAALWALRRVPVPARARHIVRRVRRRATPEWGIAVLASALSIGFYSWYAIHGLLFVYGDAVSHLMVARRVLVGRTTGLAQLGSVWLPLNHVLILPLVWNDALWRDGFAGAFPSMVAYVVASVYMFRSGRLLFATRTAGFVAAAVFMLNPSVLYMQSTAMSESDLLCAAIVAVYYLLRWAQSFQTRDLVIAAAAIAAGTLVRYDGWALAGAAALVVAFVAWRWMGWDASEAHTILFGTLAFAGCTGWVLYNALIFHDPLEFLRGPYSSQHQNAHIQVGGGLYTLHNLPLSLREYGQSVLDAVGWPIAAIALLGLIYFALRSRLRLRTLPAYAVLVPFAFNCASLYLGISFLETPEIKLGGVGSYYNGRYGMMMIPAVALFLASWSSLRRREVLIVILGLVIAFSAFNPALGTAYVLRDPLSGSQLAVTEGDWLAAHYHGGTVLISGGPFESMQFFAGLPDQVFLTEGDAAEFRAAVADPETSATWIVMASDSASFDPVWAALHNRQDWRQYFVLRTTIGTAQIYQRIGSK